MTNQERYYPESLFGGFTDIDGTVAFYLRINSLIEPSFVVLDVGCGRGSFKDDRVSIRKNLRILKGKVSKVIGIDIDPKAQENPFLDEYHHISDDSWPVESNSINLIVCDYVLEHIEDPDQFFLEIKRVLKPGGLLCIRTSNRWSYVAAASILIPNQYHSKVTSVVQNGRKDEDVFPTVYKCNSIRMIRRAMKSIGFECVVYGYEAEPAYLSFSKIAYSLGVFHQKFAPDLIKPVIFAFGKLRSEIT